MPAELDRYLDRGASGFANLILPSGQRTFLSLAAKGLQVNNLIWKGRLPGRTLYKADAAAVARMVTIFGREVERLPKLPDKAAMDSFLVIAMQAIKDPGVYGRNPKDEEGETTTPLAILTRAVLDEPDQEALVRRLSRAAATPI